MIKKPKVFIGIFLACFSLLFSSCSLSLPGTENNTKKELLISSMPLKTTYNVGELLSLDGLVVIDKNSKEEIKDYSSIPVEGYKFQRSDVGYKNIIISKENYKDINFVIEIENAQSSDPLANQKDAAISYLEEYFDKIQFSLYDPIAIETLNNIFNQGKTNIQNATSEEEIDSILLATIQELKEVPIAQGEIEVESIEITSLPTKTTYFVGDMLDLAGLEVYANYSDGSHVKIQNYTYEEVDLDTAGTKIVVIKYGEFSTSFEIVVKVKTTGIKTLEIYATNDIHGQIEGQSGRLSIGTLMTYLKDKGDQDNTLLLDQGDTWQGSIYSNYNHGALITDIMNYVKFDARTVGNHDFDWGVSYVESNTAREYNGYKTPVLAANVYDFDFATKTIGNAQQSSVGVKSVSYITENGLKVGVIGCIGKEQITSISSIYTQDIAFVDHISVIKEEALKLRNEGCDIIISSNHAGQEDLLGNGLEDYVDLVLCAHTHQREETTENDLFYAQYGAYNRYVGHITLEYNCDTQEVSYKKKEAITASSINYSVDSVDTTIASLVDQYNEQCNQEANELVASNVYGSFYSTEEMPNLMCKAIYDKAVEEGFKIDLAYCNQARASLYDSIWTYADLYQAFPFDNKVYIIEVTYNEMLREVSKYNYVYRSPSFDGNVTSGKKYRIACLDYLVFHTNSNRYYDYFFDNCGEYVGVLEDNYRIILRNWLKNNHYNGGSSLSSSDYSSSQTAFSRDFNFM